MKTIPGRRFSGRGIAGIFRGLAKFFKPLINFLTPAVSKIVKTKTGQKLLKEAKKSAFKAGISTASDILEGKNVKDSMGDNLKKAGNSIINNMSKVSKKNHLSLKKFQEKDFTIFLPKVMKFSVSSAKKHLEKNWDNVNCHIAFLGPEKLHKFYKVLSYNKICEILSSFESFSLMRLGWKQKEKNPTLALHVRDVF